MEDEGEWDLFKQILFSRPSSAEASEDEAAVSRQSVGY